MCRAVLGGPGDEGRASHQIALTTCDECGRVWQDGAGQPIEVPPVVLERAQCDAQIIGRLDAEHPERAQQKIPPAVRRQVFRRDHGRCVVPGCRSARYLDLHHVHFRSDGGSDDPSNLLTLCGVHHDALHDGRLTIEGSPGEWRFLRADGRPYGAITPLAGAAPSHRGPETQAALRKDAHAAMRGLGFREAETRAALDHAWSVVGPHGSLETYLRAALAATRRRAAS
jgi:hypothetical protein